MQLFDMFVCKWFSVFLKFDDYVVCSVFLVDNICLGKLNCICTIRCWRNGRVLFVYDAHIWANVVRKLVVLDFILKILVLVMFGYIVENNFLFIVTVMSEFTAIYTFILVYRCALYWLSDTYETTTIIYLEYWVIHFHQVAGK